MRKPGPLTFTPLSRRGDIAVLTQYLSSTSTQHCPIPTPQLTIIQSRIRTLLSLHHNYDHLSSPTSESNFFAVLTRHPPKDTVRMKWYIGTLFDEEYDIGHRCLSPWMERLAESVNGGEMRVEGCEGEMGRVMDFVGVDEETVEWKEEREWRSDAVLVPMFRRVRAFKKAQRTWNDWKYKFHDIPPVKIDEMAWHTDVDESPFTWGPEVESEDEEKSVVEEMVSTPRKAKGTGKEREVGVELFHKLPTPTHSLDEGEEMIL